MCDFKGILQPDASNLRWKLRSCVNRRSHAAEVRRHRVNIARIVEIIIIIIITIIYCNWVVTRWQWLFYIYTKYEIGY